MAILTLQNYKDFFGITGSDDDTRISAVIAAIEDWINIEIYGDSGSTTMETQTYTDEVYNGTGNEFLRLRGRPIQSITNVKIGYNTSASITYVGADFIFDADKALLYFDPSSTTSGLPGYFPCGTQNIAVTYVAGWDADNAPASLKYNIAQIAQIKLARTEGNPLLTSETLGDYKYVIGGSEDEAILAGPAMNDIKRVLGLFKPVKFIF
jgi:hypothetical protein